MSASTGSTTPLHRLAAPPRHHRRALLLVSCLLLAACQVDVLDDTSTAQANRAIRTLGKAGLTAEKRRSKQKGRYAISVDRADAARAWRILAQQRLPRPAPKGLADVFSDVGLVPTPTQEHAMMRHALSGEIAKTLLSIEGVTDARVHVVVPTRRRAFAADNKDAKARASVLLTANESLRTDDAAVRKLVSGAIDKLAEKDVKVVILREKGAAATTATPMTTVGPFRVTTASRVPLLATLLLLIAAVLALIFVAIALARRQPAPAAQRFDLEAYSQTGFGNTSATGLGSVGTSLSLIGRSVARRGSAAKDSRAKHP